MHKDNLTELQDLFCPIQIINQQQNLEKQTKKITKPDIHS